MLRFLYEKARTAFAPRTEPEPPPPDKPASPAPDQYFDERLLAVLVCPSSREALRYDREAGELIADQAGLAYKVADGIPILLVSEARRVIGETAR